MRIFHFCTLYSTGEYDTEHVSLHAWALRV